jgi:hypothetical protein
VGFGVKLTFEAKHYRTLTRAYNPCKYTGPIFQKVLLLFVNFFVGVCGTKK